MRILHMIGTLNPEAGGPPEVVRVLVRNAPAGYSFEVVTLDDPAAAYLHEARRWGAGVEIHAMGPVGLKYGYTGRLVPWLRANRGRFDCVVVHGLWQYCGLAVRRAMGGRVPYVVFTHGMLDPYFKRAFPLKHWKKWLYWAPVEYRVLRDAYRVIFTCEVERVLAEESFWLHKWTPWVVPYGTMPPEGDAAAQREEFFALCPEVRGRRFLLFLGRIHPKKGCDLLMDAFAKIAAKDAAIDLVIAGPDQQGWRARLEQIAKASGIAGRIHWPGMLRGDAKWGAFYAAEAFVLPSHQENFGIAVAEALACGRAVLLSDKVNIAAEIAQDGAGLMETDTAAGTARLLERWMAMTGGEREAMGVRAAECFRRRYDLRENVKTIVRVFEGARARE
jgi:glycosyltransferase involved in cell wall biosynthesis